MKNERSFRKKKVCRFAAKAPNSFLYFLLFCRAGNRADSGASDISMGHPSRMRGSVRKLHAHHMRAESKA